MAALKKYNLSGNEVGEVAVVDDLVNATANTQMIKDYIVAIRANARQWNANTKTRSEVNHSTKKPHPQKKTGNARQGSLASPQYKGGGRVHTPRTKVDQHVRVNRKERRAAMCAILGEKIRNNQVLVLEDATMDLPKTKTVVSFLKKVLVRDADQIQMLGNKDLLAKRVLFLGEGESARSGAAVFSKSVRNIPKTQFMLAAKVSGYELVLAQQLIITEAALQELNAWFNA